MSIELFKAAAENDAATIRRLVNDGADPNAVFQFGHTVLHNACISGNTDAVEELLSLGANPNRKYTYRSPVDGRVERGLVALMTTPSSVVAQLLIDNGADPDLCDECGNTALMRAAKRGHPEVVRVLLAAGAQPRTKNVYGNTARDFALDMLDFFKKNASGFIPGHAEKRVCQLQEVCRLLSECEEV